MSGYPIELERALQDYVSARAEHEGLLRQRPADSSERETWQAEVRRADAERRRCHNRAADALMEHGLAPRLPGERERELANGRALVLAMLGLK